MPVTDDFSAEFGKELTEEVLTDLVEAICSGESTFGKVTIVDRVRSDQINSSGWAFFTHNDVVINFQFRNGDWDGTQVLKYGPDESFDYEKPKQYTRIAVLDESRIHPDKLPLAREQFKYRKLEIEEMMRKMNYDMFFSPTSQVKKHYQDWLHKNLFTTETVEVGG